MCLLLSAFEPPKLGCSIPARRRLWLLFLWKIGRIGILPAISINKDVTVSRVSSPPGHSGRRKTPAISSHQTAATPYGEPQGTSGCEKHRTLAPDSLKVKVKSLSRVWLSSPMDCILPGSSVHGIFQARVLEWVAVSFSRGSSQHRDQTQVSCNTGGFFTIWATREAHIT